MIQYQILQTNITRTVWEIVRRIANEILGVTGLREAVPHCWNHDASLFLLNIYTFSYYCIFDMKFLTQLLFRVQKVSKDLLGEKETLVKRENR